MKKRYTSKNVQRCLEIASAELQVQKDEIEYCLIEEKGMFFSKSVTIEVTVPDKADEAEMEGCGTAKVVSGNIIVKDPAEGGAPAVISPSSNVKLMVDGEETRGRKQVFSTSDIKVILPENDATREMDIFIDETGMNAYLTMKCKPKCVYGLNDEEEKNEIQLVARITDNMMPEKFTMNDIKAELTKNRVIHGIIEENIEEALKCDEVKEVLVAKGQEAVDGEDDRVEILFHHSDESHGLVEDEKGNVNFKSIGSVDAVLSDVKLAEKIQGKPGKDGMDVRGKIKKAKAPKTLKIKTGQGTVAKENEVHSLIPGKPCFRNGTFYVFPVHEIQGDVDLESGDVSFLGDLVIRGSIREGMKVQAGNSVTVHGDIERAEVTSKGEGVFKKNVLSSHITCGGQDVLKENCINNLKELSEQLKKLFETTEEIKKFNLLGQDRKDGEIIKVLLETKFKSTSRTCISSLASLSQLEDFNRDDLLISNLRGKLIGLGPINIKRHWEIEEICQMIDDKISYLSDRLKVPADMVINYCQDSRISSSGNIWIVGKGEYVSNIIANNGVYFQGEKAIARGGSIKAENEIRCKIVGSTGNVVTRLETSSKGHIYADLAFPSTVFSIGGKEHALMEASKNVHAYEDKDGEIIVDKLKASF